MRIEGLVLVGKAQQRWGQGSWEEGGEPESHW